MKQNTFYMIFAENCNVPTYKHVSYQNALAEAKRLSEKLNVPCYILEARQKIVKNVFQITDLERPDELPF